MFRRIDDLSVSLKVFLVGLVMTFVALLTCVVALNGINSMGDEMDKVNKESVARLSLLSLALGQENRVSTALTPLYMPVMPEATKQASRKTIDASLTKMKEDLDAYGKKAAGSDMEASFTAFYENFRNYNNSSRHFLLKEPPIEGEPIVTNEADVVPLIEKVNTQLDKMTADETMLAEKSSDRASDARTSAVRLLVIMMIAALAIGIPLGMRIAKGILDPIRQVSDALKALARGDLRAKVEVRSRDEIGQMATDLSAAQAALRKSMNELLTSSHTLGENAVELSQVSRTVAENAQETSERSQQAARQAEEVSGHVQTVAAATEQVSASIREISQSSSDAVRVAASAMTEAKSATGTVAKLGDSSAEIGSVVKAITSIAEQTNLLALNATIEAARAGDAGKGFAVVANEVKDLAQETARSTEDITVRIASIQSDSQAAVEVIARITEIIEEINSYQTTIASAVEEQSATTSQMAENVSGAAEGAASIASGIEQVAEAAKSSSAGIGKAQEAATELTSLSEQLRATVNHFQL